MSKRQQRREKVSSFYVDFKKFLVRGNIVNLAIAVIIGGTFGKIVTSLVNDIIMPVLSLLFNAQNFNEVAWVLRPAKIDAVTGEVLTAEVAIRYGAFILTILDFVIIAFFIFLMFRLLTKARVSVKKAVEKKNGKEIAAEEPAAPPPKPTTEELLGEIRDILKASRLEQAAAEPEKTEE